MATFAIGRCPDKEIYRKPKKKRTRDPFTPLPCWRIIPCALGYRFTIDTLRGNTFLEKMKSIEEMGSTYLVAKHKFFTNYKPNPDFVESLKQLKKECKRIMVENQILRWKFKRFVTRWRLNRFKRINDIDFVTMMPIEKPIYFPSFETKSMYTFEAASILQDIHKKLLHHDGEIPSPLFPRNPYTNEEFTVAQLAGIFQQCKQQGKAIWTLESLAKHSFDIDTFLQYQRKTLRFNSIKSILSDLSEWQGQELLLNFIETHHEEHEVPFQKLIYRWSIINIPREERIKKWINVCRDYYEKEILAEDQSDKDVAYYIARHRSSPLCSPPTELIVKRSLFLQMKKDGARSSGI